MSASVSRNRVPTELVQFLNSEYTKQYVKYSKP
jgi:hypothetical protein